MNVYAIKSITTNSKTKGRRVQIDKETARSKLIESLRNYNKIVTLFMNTRRSTYENHTKTQIKIIRKGKNEKKPKHKELYEGN